MPFFVFVKEEKIMMTLIAFALFSAAIHVAPFGHTENAGKPLKEIIADATAITAALDDTSSGDAVLKALIEFDNQNR
jgi:hypothetical protein